MQFCLKCSRSNAQIPAPFANLLEPGNRSVSGACCCGSRGPPACSAVHCRAGRSRRLGPPAGSVSCIPRPVPYRGVAFNLPESAAGLAARPASWLARASASANRAAPAGSREAAPSQATSGGCPGWEVPPAGVRVRVHGELPAGQDVPAGGQARIAAELGCTPTELARLHRRFEVVPGAQAQVD